MASKSIFDLIKVVFEDQRVDAFDNWDEADQRAFQPYMINRIISMHFDYLPLVNEVQQFGLLGPRETYLFYSQILPKGKHFSKYIKSSKKEKYEDWLITLIATHFSVSKHDAVEYLDILSRNTAGKKEIRQICEDYAVDPKLMKKAKL